MITGIALLTGALLVGALVALVTALMPRVPHLAHTLAGLTGDVSGPVAARDLSDSTSLSRSDRVGNWLYRHSPLTLSARQRQNLQLRGQSIAGFYADKAVGAVLGFFLPVVVLTLWTVLLGVPVSVPIVVGLLGGLVGWFIPNVGLRSRARSVRSDADDALLTFMDLVTLERLANASATSALHNAANLSDIELFRQIRAALERARLEQQAPWVELRRLAEQLDLPALTDVADVMQLDETGAALSGALRARVRELRDAHLTQTQQRANAASENMTIWMTIPALIFGLIYLVPPLLRIFT